MSNHRSDYKNPYDFVPLEGDAPTPPPAESRESTAQDRWYAERNTGLITATLVPETPLFIHGADQQNKNPRAFIRDTHGRIVIPATSLKGALRSVAETVSDGCLGVLSDEHQVAYRERRLLRDRELPKPYRPCSESESACTTCLLFGMTEESEDDNADEKPTPLAGRVYVSDARPTGELRNVNVDIPAPRGGPSPKHTSFYFHDNPGRILGRKFYYHHLNYRDSIDLYFDVNPRHRPDPVTLEAVTGAFTFTVRFHNLTDDELDLLVYTLALEDNLRHHLGFAKPYGLGSARIEIQNLQTAARQNGVPARYLTLDPNPDQVWTAEAWRPRRDRVVQDWRDRSGGQASYEAFTHIMRWHDRELYQYPPYLWFRDQRDKSQPDTLAEYQAARGTSPATPTTTSTGGGGTPTTRSHQGRVSWFDEDRGFGFIRPSSGEEVFVHISEVAGQERLEQGQRVAFNVVQTPKGPRAVDVTILSGE